MSPTTEAGTAVPRGIEFTNSEGELGILSGRVTIPPTANVTTENWVQRLHPLRPLWVEDERRERASFISTRRHLSAFIVRHRFEGSAKSVKLVRAQYGYGVGLNQAYLHEIFGHIRDAPAKYDWGGLEEGSTAGADETLEPSGGLALQLWNDATGDGVSWTSFFEGRTLEWLLTSPGGFILVDAPAIDPANPPTDRSQEEAQGIRPMLRFLPNSWVEDFGRGPRGYRWIKFAETEDEREPNPAKKEDTGFRKRHVLYELVGEGPFTATKITRWDDDAKQMGPPVFQRFFDVDGVAMLPIVEVKLAEHPDIPFFGKGLLMGLDDIVIDLYNILTETREAFRDAAFGFLKHKGPDGAKVRDQLKDGSRFVDMGDDTEATLERESGGTSEVDAGMALIELGMASWAQSAKRKAQEAMESAQAKSGVALKAEFQLDLKPLLTTITETLDGIERETLFVVAQMAGESPERADELNVERETEFQLEQEASRVARIVKEFVDSGMGLPAFAKERISMRWFESSGLFNFDEPVEGESGATEGERLEEQVKELSESEQLNEVRSNQFPGPFTPGREPPPAPPPTVPPTVPPSGI